MRLIDADKIGLTDFEIVMCTSSYENALSILLNKIFNAPTVDAVPVIRCIECKHRDEEHEYYCNYHCNVIESIKNDYCSHAERKEECVIM